VDLVLMCKYLVLNKYQQVSKKKERSIHSVVAGDVGDMCKAIDVHKM